MAFEMKAAPALLLALAVLPLAGRQPPNQHWRQVGGGGVTVVFPRGYEASAAHVLAFAREMRPRLQEFWGVRLRGRLRVVINDCSEEANASASFFPYNLIEINRREPEPYSELGGNRDWLDLTVLHEMSHLFTLHAARGWLRALRSVFGANPVLFPIALLPGWTIEGLAIYGESSFGEPGRLGSPDYRLMTDAAGRSGGIPHWQRLPGQPTFWPGPRASYLYGGMFFAMLRERYGHQAIVRYLHRQGDAISFLSTAWGYPRAFGPDLKRLWREYRDLHRRADPPGQPPVVLTRSGFYKDFPLEVSPGRIVYARADLQRFDAVEAVETGGGKPRRLFCLAGVNGLSFDPASGRLYLSAVDGFAAWREVSDLYAYSLDGKRLERLSRGLRLSAPAADPAGGGLFCIQRLGESSRLVRYDPARRRLQPLSGGFAGLAQTAPAPDGRLVAAALKRAGHNWAVAVFSDRGELLTTIASPQGGKWHQPVWQAGDLYFIAEDEGRFYPARYRPVDGTVEAMAGETVPAPRHFSFSGDGSRLVISGFGPGGFEIGLLPLAGATWRPLAAAVETPASAQPPVSAQPTVTAGIPYRPLADLWPQVWSPLLRLSGRDLQLGAYTTGQDAPGTHLYSLSAHWGLRSREPNFALDYRFSGLFPTLIVSVERKASLERETGQSDFTRRESRVRLAADWPLAVRRRWQLWLRSDLHAERRLETAEGLPAARLDLNGVRLQLRLHRAQVYYDSIGPADGFRLNLSLQQDWRRLGSSMNLTSAVAEVRHYVCLPRPHLLAWRLALADSWGQARRLYRMGGAESADTDHAADGDPFGLMRGLPDGWLSGRGGWLLNLEYRLALFKVERSGLPWANVNRFYLSLFSDIGNLWGERRNVAPAVSTGAELNVVFYVSGLRWVAAGGVALTERPSRPVRLFVRLGSSF